MDRITRTETYDRTYATITREGVDPARGDDAADLVIQTYSYEDDVTYYEGEVIDRQRVTSMPEEVHADVPLDDTSDATVIAALHAAGWEPVQTGIDPLAWEDAGTGATIEVQPA